MSNKEKMEGLKIMLKEIRRFTVDEQERQKVFFNDLKEKDIDDLAFEDKVFLVNVLFDVLDNQIFADYDAEKLFIYDNINKTMTEITDDVLDDIIRAEEE